MQQIDYRVVRLLIGMIAGLLPPVVVLMTGEFPNSISAAYHYGYGARDWFVGLLFAVAALFLSYKGEDGTRQRTLSLIASVCAVLIAIAPCKCEKTSTPLTQLHYPAAVLLFLILAYFCWRFRTNAIKKIKYHPRARRRAPIYTLCFFGMTASLVLGGVYPFFGDQIDAVFPSYTFFLESLGLFSFGLSWLVASLTIPYITDDDERYRLIRSSSSQA